MKTTALETKVHDFPAQKRIAVAGVSRNNSHHPAGNLMAIAITVTAFRHGEGWAWWASFVGNTIAFVSAMTYDRTLTPSGPSSCRYTSVSPSPTALSR